VTDQSGIGRVGETDLPVRADHQQRIRHGIDKVLQKLLLR
jgi:hypothetical protein